MDFVNGGLAACQPFSLSPRRCIGKMSSNEELGRRLLCCQLGSAVEVRGKNSADLMPKSRVRGNAFDDGTIALEFRFGTRRRFHVLEEANSNYLSGQIGV